jgi:iron(III) transport system substrate-binding protein
VNRLAPVLAVLALAMPACGIGAGSDELTIYSGRSRDLVEPLLNRFAEETGVAIAVKYGDSTDLALLLAEEGDRSPADVFFSQSPGTVGFLDERGLLTALPDDVVSAVPEDYRSGDGRWVGITARQRVLVYNADEIDEEELPTSILDLTDPDYRGRVAVAPSNASFQDFVTAMRQRLGDDETLAWLEGMATNESPVYANNNAIVEAVGRGEVPMGLVNHYYNERFLAEDPSLPSRNAHFESGDLGNLVIESSATVLASNDRGADAQRFVEYLLSEDAQRYFAEETFEYPLAEGVPAPPNLTPLDELEPPEVDIDELGAGFEGTQELIDRSGIAS